MKWSWHVRRRRRVSKCVLTGSVWRNDLLGSALARGEFDIWVLFFDESLLCFVVLYSSSRELLPELFFLPPLFVCHVIKLMLRPHLLMNAGTKSTYSAAFRTNGAFEKKKNLFPLLFINILKKMNVKWESLQQGLCIIIYLLAEVKNNETILSFKALLE